MANPAAYLEKTGQDVHSYSEPHKIRVSHLHLDLQAEFNQRILTGSVTLSVQRLGPPSDAPLVLDTRDLRVHRVETSEDGIRYADATFEIGETERILGAPLVIFAPRKLSHVRIRYSTSPNATGLQWLDPSQTAGKKLPYLYTQSQEIHARSWIPLQDSPGVRVTFSARLKTRQDLFAIMGARNNPDAPREGVYEFQMEQPIPPYLIALAMGDIRFAPTGTRTGVYAEAPILDAAARELEDAEAMIQAAEQLYGPYRWGRYDLLILPPSFPFGGMEIPSVSFMTPTLIAGDKSLVSLISHELAHAWSGNLVTNATWSDFWLNEGFTTYIQYRIQERVYGRERAEMEEVLERSKLAQEMAHLDPRDQVLHIDLNGRDPDIGSTLVPYVKGALFLQALEQAFGRKRFDQYLKNYFEHFAFQSITTQQAIKYLKEQLLDGNPEINARVPLQQWLCDPGIPSSAPRVASAIFTRVEEEVAQWRSNDLQIAAIPQSGWSTQEWLYFLHLLPLDLGAGKMEELDRSFHLSAIGNSEILAQWLLMAVRNRYEPAYARLEEFLTSVGRRRYLTPLYAELVKTSDGRKRAEVIYAKARAAYHPITQATVDQIVKTTT